MVRILELGVILVLTMFTTSNLAGQMPEFMKDSEEVPSIGQIISKFEVQSISPISYIEFSKSQFKLFGNVKLIESFSYDFVKANNNTRKIIKSHSFYTFDPEGKGIEDIVYDLDGKLIYKKNLIHDKQGNLIKSEVYSISEGKSEHVFIYDKKGTLVKERWRKLEYNNRKYEDEGDIIKFIDGKKWSFMYDADGRQIEANLHNPDGSIAKKEISEYEFDEEGNFYSSCYMTFYGSYWYETIYKYDNNILKTAVSMHDTTPYITAIYIYDEYNNVLIKDWKSTSGEKQITYMKFDENGEFLEGIQPGVNIPKAAQYLIIRRLHSLENDIIISKNDKNRNTSKIESDDLDENFIYKSDRKGNWIEKIKYENGIPVFMEKRIIVYY